MEELNNWFHTHNPGNNNINTWVSEAGGVDKLSEELNQDFKRRISRPAKIISFRNLAAVAAVALVMLSIGLLWFTSKNTQPQQNVAVSSNTNKNEIKPGGNNAILTLANGEEIVLNETGIGEVTRQNNMQVNKLADSSISYKTAAANSANTQLVYNTLYTPRGGKYNLVLADGTQVTLDAESSITFPVAFIEKERRVTVTGQAYFNVVHNAAKPFYVEANGQVIKDVGTAFNVNAYPDDKSVKITLAEGLIDVSNSANTKSLVPGQQAIVRNNEKQIRVKTVNVDEIIAWKNGWFAFHNESIQNVMKQAARWYDVDIIYEGKPITKRFGGNISKYKDIDELLENLKITGIINYKIQGRRVILTN